MSPTLALIFRFWTFGAPAFWKACRWSFRLSPLSLSTSLLLKMSLTFATQSASLIASAACFCFFVSSTSIFSSVCWTIAALLSFSFVGFSQASSHILMSFFWELLFHEFSCVISIEHYSYVILEKCELWLSSHHDVERSQGSFIDIIGGRHPCMVFLLLCCLINQATRSIFRGESLPGFLCSFKKCNKCWLHSVWKSS